MRMGRIGRRSDWGGFWCGRQTDGSMHIETAFRSHRDGFNSFIFSLLFFFNSTASREMPPSSTYNKERTLAVFFFLFYCSSFPS